MIRSLVNQLKMKHSEETTMSSETAAPTVNSHNKNKNVQSIPVRAPYRMSNSSITCNNSYATTVSEYGKSNHLPCRKELSLQSKLQNQSLKLAKRSTSVSLDFSKEGKMPVVLKSLGWSSSLCCRKN